MIKKIIALFIFASILSLTNFSCKSSEDTKTDSDKIIDKAYDASGSNLLDNSELAFSFRNRIYRAIRENGNFQLEREFKDSLGEVKDVLKNDGFSRYINGELASVSDSMAGKYERSVNSVHYFSVLPFGLKDDAVNSKYLGKTKVQGKCYDLVEITFEKQGGGEDHNDVFLYWFNCETHLMDYLAYLYYTDGGGIRFREAYNQRRINGVVFNDYNNYKPLGEVALKDLDSLFEAGKLELLSKIETENITLELIDGK